MLNSKKKLLVIICIMLFWCINLSGVSAVTNSNENAVHNLNSTDVKQFADELIKEQLEKYHIAGTELSVVKDGEIIFESGYGVYNKNMDKEVSSESTLFRIGSITKLFTWTAVMQLVEKGDIDLDKDINNYLKDFKIPNIFDKPITMRNLMTHTSGFEDRLSNIFYPPDTKITPLGEYLKDTMPNRIYEPGEIIAYSNYGAALAGFIVEQVSGMDYSEYVNKNIIEPLGMNNTFFRKDIPEDLKDNESLGIKYTDEKIYKGFPDAIIQSVPTGSISSTAHDMSKFMIMHLQNGRFEDKEILNESTAKMMHTQQYTSDEKLPGICLGFMEWNRNGKRIIWHSGGTQLFMSLFMLIPDENVGVFISYNSPEADKARSEFRQSFLDRYYPYESKDVTPMNGYKERAKRYEGDYLEARTAKYNSDKLMYLLSRGKDVTVNDDGTISFRDTKYVEVEPLVFHEVDGQGLLVFKENEKHEITNAFQDFEPHEAYIKLPWYLSLKLQLSIFVVCWLIFIVRVINHIISRKRRMKKEWYIKDINSLRIGRKLIVCIDALNATFPLVFIAGIFIDITFGKQLIAYGKFSFISQMSFIFPIISAVLSFVALAYIIYAWVKKIWSVKFRIRYSLILIIYFVFALWIKYWNLMGWV